MPKRQLSLIEEKDEETNFDDHESSSLIQKPLLAVNVEDLSKLNFPVLCTPKIDGIRALRIGNDLVSRQFKLIKNERMRSLLSELLPQGADGEIMVQGTFQAVTSAVMTSKNSKNYDGIFTYYMFDFVKNDAKKPYVERMQDMKDYFKSHPQLLKHKQAKIVPLYPKTIENVEQLIEYEIEMLKHQKKYNFKLQVDSMMYNACHCGKMPNH